MPVATISFNQGEQSQGGNWADIYGLADSVTAVLDRHFSSYDQAASAQEEYRRVLADIDADTSLPLFGASEAIRASLAAHPMALAWSEFETEAAGKINPARFSIRFTG